jgi:predicted Rossmann fold nucleotide-binding protein DprA/Smf involved in DNA uptake
MENEYSMITFETYNLILESLMDTIIKAIPKGGITVSKLASKIGKGQDSVGHYLKRAIKDGKVERPGHGVYIKKGDKVDPKLVKKSSFIYNEVINAIPKGGITTAKLKKKLNAENHTYFSNSLTKAVKNGKIERVGWGVYVKKGDKVDPKLVKKSYMQSDSANKTRLFYNKRSKKILDLIPKGGIRFSDLTKKAEISQGETIAALNRLIRQGKIEKPSKGVYIKKGDTLSKDVKLNSYGSLNRRVLDAIPKGGIKYKDLMKKLGASKNNSVENQAVLKLFRTGKIEKAGWGVYVKKGDKVDPKKILPIYQDVLDNIPKGGITAKELISKSGRKEHIIRGYINKAKKDGKIEHVGRGVYVRKGDKVNPKKILPIYQDVLDNIPKGGITVKKLISKSDQKENIVRGYINKAKKDGKIERAGHGVYVRKGDKVNPALLSKPKYEKIVDAIPKGGITAKKLLSKSDEKENIIRNHIGRALKAGKIERAGHGVYVKKGDKVDPALLSKPKKKDNASSTGYPSKIPSLKKWTSSISW